MMQSFEDTNKLGKEYIDSGLQSAAALSKGFQAIAVETTEFSKKSFDTATAAIEKLAAAKSLDTAIQVQSDYAKQAYEAFRRRGHQAERSLCRPGQGRLQAVRIGRVQNRLTRVPSRPTRDCPHFLRAPQKPGRRKGGRVFSFRGHDRSIVTGFRPANANAHIVSAREGLKIGIGLTT